MIAEDGWVAGVVESGQPEFMARFMLGIYQVARDGFLAGTDPVLGQLVGRARPSPLRTTSGRGWRPDPDDRALRDPLAGTTLSRITAIKRGSASSCDKPMTPARATVESPSYWNR